MKLGNIPPLHQWGISVPRRGILATFLSLNPVQTNSAQYIQSVKYIREHTLVRKTNVLRDTVICRVTKQLDQNLLLTLI